MKRIVMIIMAAVLVALPTMAQQQQWQSTSTMQPSGSSLAPQVTAVGATSVNDMATTTTAPAHISGPRRDKEGNTGFGEWEEGSPIGDALLPLMLMALAFGGVIALRRKRSALNS